jgi:hypothetical protein
MGFGRLRFRRSFGQVKSQFRGARPKFYPLFTGLLDTYAGASAAYSLRRLSKIASSVVRVRRASDNAEKDFTADDITDSSMVNWVNGQIVPPLDIRELDSNGERTGDLVEAAAAYSLRNLSASYTGSVVEVRRSSDDAEDSFTAAEVADGTLVTWVGAGNDGFVKNWYDQSGNNNHATQGTDASQPKIVDSGSLVSGGLDFDGVDDSLALSGSGLDIFKDVGYGQVFAVATSNETGLAFGAIFRLKTNTGPTRYSIGESNATNGSYRIGGRRLDSDSFDSTTASTPHGATQKVVTGFLNYADGEAYIYQNGVNIGTDLSFQTAGNTSNTSSFGGDVGGGAGGAAFDGTIQEIIIYNSDQSDNRTAIEANIGDHYDIDLPSGVDTGYDQVDGFVETWYDQSGNGNDAVQQVSGSQPKIVDAGVLVSGGLDFDGVNDGLSISGQVLTSSLFYATSVMNHATGTSTFGGESVFGQYQVGTSGRFHLTANSSNQYSFFANATDSIVGLNTGAIGTAQTLISVNGDGSNAEIWRDGTSKATDTYSGFTPANVNFTIGIDASGDRKFNGKIAEVIIYPSDESANREAIETNINNQYDIY